MARLVHIAPEQLQKRIERSGLRGEEWTIPVGKDKVRMGEAIFAMPSYRDEQVTYQWVRELKTWRHSARMVAVIFEIDAATEVLYGRFGKPKRRGIPHEAYVAIEADPMGAEVVVSGPIALDQIVSVRSIRQDIGWQGTPEPSPHGNCACPACLPSGHPKLMRRIRAQYNAAIERIHGAGGDPKTIVDSLSELSPALERGRGRLSPKRLVSLTRHEDPCVRKEITSKLSYFKWGDVEEHVVSLIADPNTDVRSKALETMLHGGGLGVARSHAGDHPELLQTLCFGMEYMDGPQVDSTLKELAAHGHAGVRAAAKRVIGWRA